jgi:PAS domain S-box-containing protein
MVIAGLISFLIIVFYLALKLHRQRHSRQQAEAALSACKLEFRNLAENSPENIIRYDLQCRAIYCNPMMTQTLSLGPEMILGKTPVELGAGGPEVDTEYEGLIRRVLESGEPSELETVMPHPAGGFRSHLIRFVADRDAQGSITGVLAIGSNITRRKCLEDALFFVAQRGWQAGSENFLDGLAQFLNESLDMDYVIIARIDEDPDMAETVALYAKSAIVPNISYALTGTPCENVIGRKLCVYPQGVQQQFPEDPLLVEMGVESYIGIPLWDSLGRPIGLIALMDSKPLVDDAQATQVLQLVATRAAAELDRERSDRILRKREHEFRTLAEGLPDHIVRYDRQGRAVYINPVLEKSLGVAAADRIGLRVREFYTDESYEAYAQAVDAALASGENGEIEIRMPVPGKKRNVFQIRTIAERDEHGEVTGVLAIGRDITERKQAEEKLSTYREHLEELVRNRTVELEAANKELEAFAYSVSHDLRAPLRHIDGFLELLQKTMGTALDEQSRHYMDTISTAAKKMELLIDNLLSFSRMGRHAMSFQPVALGPLVREVVRELEPDAAGRAIDWRIGDLPVVDGDAAMLRIVLDNLIANALKFTRHRQQARIEIGSLPDQDAEAVILVRDNGVGFDMTYADKLFGVFQRLHRAEEFEGTGIGLANVRRIIARHGGRTWAEGEPDKGAAFYFALPFILQGGGDEKP